jgi:D-proline reductase (dithiol) PrdB
VGLLARALESESITTVCVVMNREITANVKAPRALYVRFPYGAPLGPAGDRETQRAVIDAALHVLTSATTPATLVDASIEWPD